MQALAVSQTQWCTKSDEATIRALTIMQPKLTIVVDEQRMLTGHRVVRNHNIILISKATKRSGAMLRETHPMPQLQGTVIRP
mmetsp:Transcript_22800/g.58370  ORF Transcript_22800/g.58370 Transcript_22800/m.58370 type:complete len:82 (+) Transcript_22800:283-528(+)